MGEVVKIVNKTPPQKKQKVKFRVRTLRPWEGSDYW